MGNFETFVDPATLTSNYSKTLSPGVKIIDPPPHTHTHSQYQCLLLDLCLPYIRQHFMDQLWEFTSFRLPIWNFFHSSFNQPPSNKNRQVPENIKEYRKLNNHVTQFTGPPPQLYSQHSNSLWWLTRVPGLFVCFLSVTTQIGSHFSG